MNQTRTNQVAMSVTAAAVLFYAAAFAGLLIDNGLLVAVAKFAFGLR